MSLTHNEHRRAFLFFYEPTKNLNWSFSLFLPTFQRGGSCILKNKMQYVLVSIPARLWVIKGSNRIKITWKYDVLKSYKWN